MVLGRIKTRESVKDIKILDNAAVVSERMKTALVRSKDQAENLMDDDRFLRLNMRRIKSAMPLRM